MKTNFNKLTPAETERLACLAEECGEVIQVIGKILRHGYADCNPNNPTHTDNRKDLEKELGDLIYWVNDMCNKGDVSRDGIDKNAVLKSVRVKQWLHQQED